MTATLATIHTDCFTAEPRDSASARPATHWTYSSIGEGYCQRKLNVFNESEVVKCTYYIRAKRDPLRSALLTDEMRMLRTFAAARPPRGGPVARFCCRIRCRVHPPYIVRIGVHAPCSMSRSAMAAPKARASRATRMTRTFVAASMANVASSKSLCRSNGDLD